MRKFIDLLEYTSDEPARVKAFEELAKGQRGEPEIAMVRAQHAIGGGVLAYCIEHVGDLTHRMAQYADKVDSYYCGYELVKPKVDRCFNMLKSGYMSRVTGGTGFQAEHDENMRNNAKHSGMMLEEYLSERVRPALRRYAEAHKKLRVYNFPQALAREAAVALGEERFDDAREHLKHLDMLLADREKWVQFASKYQPGYADKIYETDLIDDETSRPTPL